MPIKRSRLLDLPPEIRLMIWEELYSDSIIHVYFDKADLRWRSVHCAQSESWASMERLAVTGNRLPALKVHDGLPDPFRARHEMCQKVVEGHHYECVIGPMLACKTLHKEIEPILYSKANFQVETGVSFAMFVDQRTDYQLAALRYVRLEIVFIMPDNKDAVEWVAALSPKRLTRLAPVRRLEISGVWPSGASKMTHILLWQMRSWSAMGLHGPLLAVTNGPLPDPEDRDNREVDREALWVARNTTTTTPTFSGTMVRQQDKSATTCSYVQRNAARIDWLRRWMMMDMFPPMRSAIGTILRVMRNSGMSDLPESREKFHQDQADPMPGFVLPKNRLHDCLGNKCIE